MKKYLYGTTALAAVGLVAGQASAAEPLHMELGGYYQQAFGFADVDIPTDANDTNSYQNAEVYFKMRGELDNGLKIGGRIELEGESTGDQIDQAYLTLAGGFGSLRLGAINSGRYSYGWNTDGGTVGMPINSGWVSNWVLPLNNSGFRFRSVGLSTVIDASNDEQKITYFTPRFSGFQFTVSWTPEGHNALSNSVGQGGETYAFTGPVPEAIFYTNGLDIGVSYSGEFEGVGIEVQAGWATATAPTAVTHPSVGFDDYTAFNLGASVSMGGLYVGASYANITDGLAFVLGTTTIASNEGEAFNIGASYNTGPYGVSATYFLGEEDGIVGGGDEENEFFTVAASYDLGSGVQVDVTYLHAEFTTDTAGSSLGFANNEGDAVIFRVGLGF